MMTQGRFSRLTIKTAVPGCVFGRTRSTEAIAVEGDIVVSRGLIVVSPESRITAAQ